MTDRRMHRGPHPEDLESFGPAKLERLREAVADLSWLLTREVVTAHVPTARVVDLSLNG